VDKSNLLRAIPKLQAQRIVVVGDLFLDEYVVGRASRLSREAPVPVLEFTRRFSLPGGGANPSVNIQALGGEALQVGVVGDDEEGIVLVESLRERGIGTEGVAVDVGRPTTTKMRVVAEGTLVFPQQLARVDRQDTRPVDEEVEAEMIQHLTTAVPGADAVLLSDYRSGVIGDALAGTCLELASRRGKTITVDSQGSLDKYQGYSLVKCNRREAERALGYPLQDGADYRRAGEELLSRLKAGAVLITLSEEGMYLSQASGQAVHIPACNRSEVFDVTGAGDTAIAAMTLALAAGLDMVAGAHLANYAAGLVIRKMGNATTTPAELAWAFENW
jgi:rfaE bifunctional protein kinase chain/domain